jgi:heterotetrameric sarcosine oxidase gamma subunit
MLLGPMHDAATIASSVNVDGFVAVLDQTHSRAMFRLGGSNVVEALEKVCSLDLSDDMTPDGAVFSASVAKVTCDLVRNDVDAAKSFLIMCDRSFGDYLFEALADAGAEFGLS